MVQLNSTLAFKEVLTHKAQKERVESEVLAWRWTPFSKENNAVIEKVHRKELLD